MATGPGKYHLEAEGIVLKYHAAGVVLIVIGGSKDSGFEVAMRDPDVIKDLPDLLRTMADQIQTDVESSRAAGGAT